MHEITKVRKEVVRRLLTVAAKEYITPRMLRVTFESGELKGFESPSPDDHIKIFLPARDGSAPVMRDFTPRAWDVAAGTLTLEFALHQSGPATQWATHARVGDTLSIGGPRGSTIVADDFDWYLLIGDATALPSIARRVETLRANVPVSVLALVADAEEQQTFSTNALCDVHWLTSCGTPGQDSLRLQAALQQMKMPEGHGFIWIATEVAVARDLYQYVVNAMNHPKQWVKAAGYWSEGQADGGKRIE